MESGNYTLHYPEGATSLRHFVTIATCVSGYHAIAIQARGSPSRLICRWSTFCCSAVCLIQNSKIAFGFRPILLQSSVVTPSRTPRRRR